jgi:nucleoside-diphosphate-sugar epimerase
MPGVPPLVDTRVMVLGASGWVGREVLALARRQHGRALGAARRPDSASMVHGVRGPDDLAALLRDERVGTVVSCVGRTDGPEVELQEANVAVPTSIGEVCRNLDVRLVHLGSAAEYGQQPDAPVKETGAEAAGTLYGLTKLAGTRSLLDLADSGLRVTVARPFNLVGPAQPASTPIGEFARAVAQLRPPRGEIEVRDSSLVRDYLSLRRTAELVLALAAVEGPRLVNVCSGRGLTFAQLITEMGEQRGIRTRIVDTAPGRSGIARIVGDPTLLHSTVGARAPESLVTLAALALRLEG